MMSRLDRRLEFALFRHSNTRNQVMSFEGRPYLLPIYLDRSRERVFKKSVQCGLSEFLIIDALESASRGLSCLYVMPTQDKRGTFVQNRVARAIRNSKFYAGLVKKSVGKSQSIGLKHFGQGVISFVGSNAESEFIEFPADFIIVDEYDRCSPENLPLVRDRLSASPFKLAAFVSTPTFPEFGISKLFEQSDAKEWHIACPHCGHRQPLDFFTHVVRREGDEFVLLDREWRENCGRDVRVFCEKCGGELDRLAQGEWVAKHPGKSVSGYHVSQLFVPTCPVSELWRDWRKSLSNEWERQRFYNSMLGEPYSAQGSGLSSADLARACRDYAFPAKAAATTMGVDVGKVMHVRISDSPEPGVRRAVYIGRATSTDELDRLMERYDVRCCVVDALPESLMVRRWQQSHPKGRIWRCVYNENDLAEMQADHAEGVVRVARTPSLDDATEDVLLGRNWLPRDAATIEGGEFFAQMSAPVRVLVQGAGGAMRYVWSKPAADHYRHADNYDKIASKLWRPKTAAKIITSGSRLF